MTQNLSSAAVVNGALRVKMGVECIFQLFLTTMQIEMKV